MNGSGRKHTFQPYGMVAVKRQEGGDGEMAYLSIQGDSWPF